MHFVDAKKILSAHNGMNLYRGCTHGCIYCDSRSKCYGFTHDFEDIEVKQNAPELLELTRRCLEIIDQYEYGVTIQTKSHGILRDLDLLKSIHQKAKCVVQMTLTTYDEDLCRILEPNVCTTKQRVDALKIFRENGIPTVVWLSPILPYLNDTMENIQGILDYCIQAGVHGIICFDMGVTLREGAWKSYFVRI